MKTTSDKATQTRLKWLVGVGYVLIGVGVLLLLLSFVLPVDLFAGPHHHYRVVPAEHGWVMAVSPIGLGIFLVLIGRASRSRSP